MSTNNDFATRLRETRKQHDIQSKEMAAHLGVTPRNYQRYESGEADPPISKVYIIAEKLGVSVDYLLGRTDNPDVAPPRDRLADLSEALLRNRVAIARAILDSDAQN